LGTRLLKKNMRPDAPQEKRTDHGEQREMGGEKEEKNVTDERGNGKTKGGEGVFLSKNEQRGKNQETAQTLVGAAGNLGVEEEQGGGEAKSEGNECKQKKWHRVKKSQ